MVTNRQEVVATDTTTVMNRQEAVGTNITVKNIQEVKAVFITVMIHNTSINQKEVEKHNHT